MIEKRQARAEREMMNMKKRTEYKIHKKKE
jgi:hypothetical protein